MNDLLKKHFGYDSFRPLQKEIIEDIIQKKDVLVLMPTGGGKSICYQIPAIMSDGLTIVVSPLISLMKDQVDGLKQLGIHADYLNSTQDLEVQYEIENKMLNGTLKILYVAPERLFNDQLQSILKKIHINFIAVDEAHCISQWGHDFRPDYRNIGRLKTTFPDVSFAALTATATNRVCKDIINQLGLKSPKIYKSSFDRSNLTYEVQDRVNSYSQILEYLKNHKGESGIIYCFSKKSVDQLVLKLQSDGYSSLPYHAGLSDEDRSKNQEMFINDDVDIIVATVAFGMGIDKPNVRFVIHQDLPPNIERYYQETGRAGRDGLSSKCILLYSYSDKSKIEYFIEQKEDESEKELARRQLYNMIDFAEATICRRSIILNYFGEVSEITNCKSCDICLNPPDRFDATEISNKIFSCIYRLNERFGVNYVAKVLTGSKSAQILENRHNNLSTYSIVNDFSTKDIALLIRELIMLGFLNLSKDKYPILKLTPLAIEYIRGKKTINLKKIKFVREVHDTKVDYDQRLFEVLRVLRKKLSTDRNIPPYLVFSDASLREMSTKFPSNLDQFKDIKGVGNQKLEEFGNIFTDEINNYLKLS